MNKLSEFPEAFELPEDEDRYIWRYMDLSKFLSLLQGNLYFPRADHLGDDDYECTLPRGNAKIPYDNRILHFGRMLTKQEIEAIDFVEKFETDFTNIATQVRQSCYVSCWHINQSESAAMWKLYLSKNEGVAVRSTTGRLLKVTENYRGASQPGCRGCISIGKVRYIDFEEEAIPLNSYLNLLMYKRSSFRHEEELRAVHWGLIESGEICSAAGKSLAIDLSTLIEHVFVAPTSQSWFEGLVTDLVQQRFCLELPVARSAMARGPLK